MTTSRIKVAHYLAEHITSNDRSEIVKQVAAWLVANRRQHQVNYVANDVAQILASRGYLQATVTTARPMTDSAQQTVLNYLRSSQAAEEIELEMRVDPTVISGVRIQTPSGQLEATGRGQLSQLVRKASL